MILAQPPVFHFQGILSADISSGCDPAYTDAQRNGNTTGREEDASPGAEVQGCPVDGRNNAAALAQFRSSRYENPVIYLTVFERVLEDEEALPKAKQILKLISVHGGALKIFYVRRVAYFLTPVI